PGAPKRINVLYLISEIRLYCSLVEAGKWNQFLFSSSDRVDIYPAASAIEAHVSIHQCKNRVIAAEPYIFPRQKFRSALTNNNVASNNHLAAKFFHTQPLADTVAPVLYTALSFFMSHFSIRC